MSRALSKQTGISCGKSEFWEENRDGGREALRGCDGHLTETIRVCKAQTGAECVE